MFWFGPLKYFWPSWVPLRQWFSLTTNFAFFFFSFMYLFLKQWCCCFLQLIKICSASLQHLVFLFIIFPLTCIPASWYILMIRYYPINLSWRDVWLPTVLILFCSVNIMDDNTTDRKPMSFVTKKDAHAWCLYYKLYCSFPLFAPNGGYYSMFIIFFNTQEKCLWADCCLWFLSVLW